MPLDNDLQTALNSITGEVKTIAADIVKRLELSETSATNMQKQLDAIDMDRQRRGGGGGGGADVMSGLSEFKRFVTENKESFEKHGRIAFEVPSFLSTKSTILSTSLTSTEPASGVQGAGRFPYRLRSLFRTIGTQLPTVGILRSNTETLNASPQVEGDPKSESTVTFTLVSAPIQTLATFVNFSKQALDDIDGFGAFIESTLIWALQKKAESEILSGSGSGVHLTGLTTSATAYDTTITSASAGWNKLDILGAGAVQLTEAGYSPNFAVVSPRSWYRMVSLRGSTGEYVLNDPRTSVGQNVYNLQILPSPAMIGDGFLVGDSSQAIIRSRERASVLLSAEHGTNFTSNLVTALAEERFGIQTLRPDAFVYGSLTSSPA